MADSLTVGLLKAVLSLDSAQYESGIRQATTSAKTAEAQFKGLGQSAGTAATPLSTLTGSVVKLGAAFGIGLGIDATVRALVGFGAEAIASASKVVDLANKTGLSTETIQRMSFVADQAGGSMEGFADAAFRLGVRLEGGSGSVRAAVDRLGLSLDALRNMDPDQQFETVVSALSKIQDATLRNQLGVELFGRSFGNIAAAVAEGYDEIAKRAKFSSDEQVRALDNAADAWNAWWKNQKTELAGFLGSFVQGMSDVAKAREMVPKMSEDQFQEYLRLQVLIEDGAVKMTIAEAAARALGQSFDQVLPPEVIKQHDSYQQQLTKVTAEVNKLDAAQRAEIDAALKLGVSTRDLEDAYGLTEGALKLYTSSQKTSTQETEKARKAAEDAAKELQRMHDELVQLERTWGAIPASVSSSSAAFNNIEIDLLDAAIAVGKLHQELVTLEASGTDFNIPSLTNNVGALEIQILDAAIATEKLNEQARQQAISNLVGEFDRMGQVIGGTGGLMIQNIGGIAEGLLKMSNASTGVIQNAGAVANAFVNIAASTDGASASQNILNGAVAGFSSMMMTGNPYLMAGGAAAGAITGWVRSMESAREEQRMLAEEADDLANEWLHNVANAFRETASQTGLANQEVSDYIGALQFLQVTLGDLGLTGAEVRQLLDDINFARTPEEAEDAINRVNALLEEHERVTRQWAEGVSMFVGGFTDRVGGLAASMADATVATEDQAASFQRMGDFATTAFSSVLEQTGSAVQAIQAIHEPLQQLIALEEQFGFTGTATYERLKDIDGVIQANADVFQSIDGLQQMMLGLDRATTLTQGDFVAFAADATALFNELIGNGVEANQAMALMQPTLQTLWELQERFGIEIDAGTQALLDQAEAAGIVGEQHKSINAQILGALLQIEDAIRRLPEAFANATGAAGILRDTLREVSELAATGVAAAGGGSVHTQDGQYFLDRAGYDAQWAATYASRYGPTPMEGGAVGQAYMANYNTMHLAAGVAPPYPEIMHEGGYIDSAHTGTYVGGMLPDERLFKLQTGESVFNRMATAAFGGREAVEAFNRNPWAMPTISRVGAGAGFAGGGGDYSSSVTVGSISVTIQGTGNPEYDGRTLVRVVLDELANGGDNASQYRRVHKQLVPA